MELTLRGLLENWEICDSWTLFCFGLRLKYIVLISFYIRGLNLIFMFNGPANTVCVN